VVIYGAFALPVYWLRGISEDNFKSLIALYVVFGVITFVLVALLNIYIPHCMRQVNEHVNAAQEVPSDNDGSPQAAKSVQNKKARRYGFAMSLFGQLGVYIAGALMLIITTILSATLSSSSSQSAGLLVTTIIGFVTIAGSVICYLGLPTLPTKALPTGSGITAILQSMLLPFRDLLVRRKNLLLLLVAYTVYTDTTFALSSITGQLFFAELRPSTLEFSLYTLAGTLFAIFSILVFFFLQRWAHLLLEPCLLAGYCLLILVPAWGCIGLASVDFGFKVRALLDSSLEISLTGLEPMGVLPPATPDTDFRSHRQPYLSPTLLRADTQRRGDDMVRSTSCGVVCNYMDQLRGNGLTAVIDAQSAFSIGLVYRIPDRTACAGGL
jgi:hypothetical protein